MALGGYSIMSLYLVTFYKRGSVIPETFVEHTQLVLWSPTLVLKYIYIKYFQSVLSSIAEVSESVPYVDTLSHLILSTILESKP